MSSVYRVLEENKQVKERRRPAKHPSRAVPELVATAPGQVFTWDITKLAGMVMGKYFDCYVMVDKYGPEFPERFTTTRDPKFSRSQDPRGSTSPGKTPNS